MPPIIAPSLLAADFGALRSEIEMINGSEADWIHLDIMDGLFVPNISFGFPVLKSVQSCATKLMDAHLMVVDPMRYVSEIKACGCGVMTIHYEADNHLDRAIHQIQEHGMKAGIALNPHTPVAHLEELVDLADMVLIMSVNPGYGNQRFIPYAVDKIRRLRELIDRRNAKTLIEVDGGLNYETGRMMVDAGADVLVGGSFVFGSEDPLEVIRQLRRL